MNIDFVSNLDLNDTSGGWNGINYQMFSNLEKRCAISYVGPINPPILYNEKIYSKLLRLCNQRGPYYFFSSRRLKRIADEITGANLKGDFVFFFGATPWIGYKIAKPYAVYLDVCFPRYLELYLRGQKFSKSDISRIADLESKFLSDAKYIFWGSAWAYKEACEIYRKDFRQSVITSTGGHIPLPASYKKGWKNNLLFISLNFEKKGGWLAFKAYKLLKNSIPDLTFTIIGEAPPKKVLDEEGVLYIGYLNKENESDVKMLISVIENSFFLIHPTVMDTMGAVIVEAGYYGLPTIAPNNFGIPDIISNEKTGILVDLPLTPEKFADKLLRYHCDAERYEEMREAVFLFTRQYRSWEAIANQILTTIEN